MDFINGFWQGGRVLFGVFEMVTGTVDGGGLQGVEPCINWEEEFGHDGYDEGSECKGNR